MKKIKKKKKNIKMQKKIDSIRMFLYKKDCVAQVEGQDNFTTTKSEIFNACNLDLDSVFDNDAFTLAKEKNKSCFDREIISITNDELKKFSIKNITEDDIVKTILSKIRITNKAVPIVANGTSKNGERVYHKITGDLQETRLNRNIQTTETRKINIMKYLLGIKDTLPIATDRHLNKMVDNNLRVEKELGPQIKEILKQLEEKTKRKKLLKEPENNEEN